jgi:hypothetical protein
MRGDGAVHRALWRWRRNPLRRREDVLEAWVLLVVWLVVAVAAPLAGVLGARLSAHAAAQQRAERYPVTATLLEDGSGSSGSTGLAGGRATATVRWTTADGIRHTGRSLVDQGLGAGARLTLWTDRRGRLTSAPPTATRIAVDSAFTGVASSVAVVAVTAAGAHGVGVVLDRRRRRAWEADWRQLGSRWGRTAN